MTALGEVSYDVRFQTTKARQDAATIEAEMDAMIGRVRSKMAGVGFGGGGRSGGGVHTGETTTSGQPVGGGSPASSYSGSGGGTATAIMGSAGTSAAAAIVAAAASQNSGGNRPAWRQGASSPWNLIPLAGGGGSGQSARASMFNMVGESDHASSVGGMSADIAESMGVNSQMKGAAISRGIIGGGGGSKLGNVAKAIGAIAIARTITNLMGAVEESLNESLGAANDPIKQQMQRRHIGRNLVGAVPIIGGMLQNIVDFSGGGHADRMDLLAIQRRELGGAARAFDAGTGAIGTRSAGSLSNSSVVRGVFGSQANEEETIASLQEEKRKRLLGENLGKYQQSIVGPMFDARISAVQKQAENERLNARRETELDIYSQQNLNERLGLEARLRPVAGAAIELGNNARNDFEVNTNFNNRLRQKPEFGNNGQLTPIQIEQNRAIDRANLLETEKLRGAAGILRGMQTDVLRNVYGGRPEEINALQSVEARRDLSPETNEDKLAKIEEVLRSIEEILRDKREAN